MQKGSTGGVLTPGSRPGWTGTTLDSWVEATHVSAFCLQTARGATWPVPALKMEAAQLLTAALPAAWTWALAAFWAAFWALWLTMYTILVSAASASWPTVEAWSVLPLSPACPPATCPAAAVAHGEGMQAALSCSSACLLCRFQVSAAWIRIIEGDSPGHHAARRPPRHPPPASPARSEVSDSIADW